MVPIVALGFPIADTLLAMGRRAARGVPLFQADREHIHHRLLARGLTQRQTALVLYAVSAVLGGVAIALAFATSAEAALLLAGLAIVGVTVLRQLGYMRFERGAKQVLETRRRNLELRNSIRDIARRLRHAAELGDIWEGVQAAAPAVGASCVGFRVVEPRRGPQRIRHYSCGFDEAGPNLFRSRHSLLGERPNAGVIEFGWMDGRSSMDRDTEIAIELLCEHVLDAVGRLEQVRTGPRQAPAAAIRDTENRRIAVS
jgi:UDP-GlcNAc:undecaprenyl-phosphate/decaprenyl-phosphate GlcNAc-1-phosphate transferase